MQYKILASDYDNTLVPFGEGKPRQKVVKAVKKLQAAGGGRRRCTLGIFSGNNIFILAKIEQTAVCSVFAFSHERAATESGFMVPNKAVA